MISAAVALSCWSNETPVASRPFTGSFIEGGLLMFPRVILVVVAVLFCALGAVAQEQTTEQVAQPEKALLI